MKASEACKLASYNKEQRDLRYSKKEFETILQLIKEAVIKGEFCIYTNMDYETTKQQLINLGYFITQANFNEYRISWKHPIA